MNTEIVQQICLKNLEKFKQHIIPTKYLYNVYLCQIDDVKVLENIVISEGESALYKPLEIKTSEDIDEIKEVYGIKELREENYIATILVHISGELNGEKISFRVTLNLGIACKVCENTENIFQCEENMASYCSEECKNSDK